MRQFLSIFLLITAGALTAEEQPFYLTLETPPAPELTPAEALASFSLAPGYRIELLAAEPLVEDPVAITWDERGDLYVVEMRGFMPDAWGRGEDEPVGAVVRLVDTDGDGLPDRRDVLMDKLVLPRAVAIVNEGMLVAEPPNLWLCPGRPGTDQDIDCSNRVSLGEYGNQPGSVEHAENGLLLALDNWIYSAKSDRRLKIIDGQLVEEPTLFRGQWGITQDNLGRLYYNTNSNLLIGDVYDAQPVIEAGSSAAPGLGRQVSRGDQVFAVRVNPGVNRAYVPGVLRADGRLDKPTSASGMAVYRGRALPDAERDVYVAEPAANVVVRLKLDTAGLEASTEHVLYDDAQWGQREFLASTDERFRPVNVSVGPDGALYVVDMYRGIIQDQVFLTDELRNQALERGLDKPVGMGRIWRVSAEADKPADVVLPAEAGSLLALLEHENGWQRDTAQRLLIGQDDEELDSALRKIVQEGAEVAALHALWTLEGRGSLRRGDVQSALARDEAGLRLSALRAGRWLLSQQTLLELSADADEAMAHHAVLYLSAYNTAEPVLTRLGEVLEAQAGAPIRVAGVQAALRGSEREFLEQMVKAERWNDERLAFAKALVTQAFRADPGLGGVFLDQVPDLDDAAVQTAVLQGLYQMTREEGFERAVLDAPHPVFSELPESLWPVVSEARRAFTWPGDDLIADLRPLSKAEEALRKKGQGYYESRCAICHGPGGEGIGAAGPPLVDSEWVNGPTETLLRVILHGLQGPIEVKGESWNSVMPGHDQQPDFTDEVAAGLLTYLHRAWGHQGRPIGPEFVRTVRDQAAGRTLPYSAAELAVLPINLHYQDYAGSYAGGLRFYAEANQLMVESVYFNGAMTEVGEDSFFFEPRPFQVEFVRDPAGAVVAIRLPGRDDAVVPRVGE